MQLWNIHVQCLDRALGILSLPIQYFLRVMYFWVLPIVILLLLVVGRRSIKSPSSILVYDKVVRS